MTSTAGRCGSRGRWRASCTAAPAAGSRSRSATSTSSSPIRAMILPTISIGTGPAPSAWCARWEACRPSLRRILHRQPPGKGAQASVVADARDAAKREAARSRCRRRCGRFRSRNHRLSPWAGNPLHPAHRGGSSGPTSGHRAPRCHRRRSCRRRHVGC